MSGQLSEASKEGPVAGGLLLTGQPAASSLEGRQGEEKTRC